MHGLSQLRKLRPATLRVLGMRRRGITEELPGVFAQKQLVVDTL